MNFALRREAFEALLYPERHHSRYVLLASSMVSAKSIRQLMKTPLGLSLSC